MAKTNIFSSSMGKVCGRNVVVGVTGTMVAAIAAVTVRKIMDCKIQRNANSTNEKSRDTQDETYKFADQSDDTVNFTFGKRRSILDDEEIKRRQREWDEIFYPENCKARSNEYLSVKMPGMEEKIK